MRILIVEDDADSGEELLALLTDVGHEARLVMMPTRAAAVAIEFRPDLAILDIGLPVMSGHELIQVLRALPELSSCRYFAVTAMVGGDLMTQSIAAGFERHLTKPLPVAQLLRFLERPAESARGASLERKASSEFERM
jgi:CheY-like chemotaxis protein